ncbi:uncharacterized protein LOC120358322 isoform X1 [Solenopsis invicta]|uniref:uncharacterized protein LOC120358322 isoform X1 n=1 Tax=Solenopsis invicta TaxID=13686 RepID=UPI00193D8928|nr:uncharacterized protein LOC120358322 isoform X1 [Solenopsis invicta]
MEKNAKVDVMSRQQRKLKKFEAFDESQTKITDYFLKTITKIIEDHPDLQNTLLSIANTENTSNFANISSFLECLKDTAMKNIKRKKHGNKFTSPLKLFSLYIFIVGGRVLYELLHANLQSILPSITTINRLIDKESNIVNGIVRLKELKLFLIKRNYPLNVFISEHQTAIIKNIAYDSKSNQMIGFVSSCKKNGFPKNNFYVNSVKDIENAFSKYVVGCNAYVYMAQPLIDNAPAFCLTVFASDDNRFNHNDVLARWTFLKNELEKLDIQITGFSNDGDTRCLKDMRIWSKIPLLSKNPYSPYFQIEFDIKKPVCIQDTVHIGTKIKTRFLKPNVFLPMGSKIVSPEHVKKLIKQFSKDKHLLCDSDLERMFNLV